MSQSSPIVSAMPSRRGGGWIGSHCWSPKQFDDQSSRAVRPCVGRPFFVGLSEKAVHTKEQGRRLCQPRSFRAADMTSVLNFHALPSSELFRGWNRNHLSRLNALPLLRHNSDWWQRIGRNRIFRNQVAHLLNVWRQWCCVFFTWHG